MKNKIVIVMCSFLLGMPVLSLAEEPKSPDFSVLAPEQATEKEKFKSDEKVLNNRTDKEIKAEELAEQKAEKAQQKENEAQDQGEGNVSQAQPDPSASAYEHANENSKFKRNRDVFNNKANKAIRAQKRVDKEDAKTKKKTEEIQDKGEGQVNVKF